MEFIVDENGCNALITDMYNGMRDLERLISELDQLEGVLHLALGEDYDSIGRQTAIMKEEFNQALVEFKTVVQDMHEYVSRVKMIRVALNDEN